MVVSDGDGRAQQHDRREQELWNSVTLFSVSERLTEHPLSEEVVIARKFTLEAVSIAIELQRVASGCAMTIQNNIRVLTNCRLRFTEEVTGEVL